jgi:hypothetical protein
MTGTNTQAHLLAAARSGDLAQAIAAGEAAGDVMGATADPLVYSDAGGALGAAFDALKAVLLAADPALAAAVADHRKQLRRPSRKAASDKLAVVSRAVDYIDRTPWAVVQAVLDLTAINDDTKRSKEKLRSALTGAPIVVAYRAAWQILDAAGQPY